MVVPALYDLSFRKFNLSELILQTAAHHSCEQTYVRNELAKHLDISISMLSKYENKTINDSTSMTRRRALQIESFFTQKMGKKMQLIEREREESLFAKIEV